MTQPTLKVKDLKIGWKLKNIATGEILKVSQHGGHLYLKDTATGKKHYCLARTDSDKQCELTQWERVA